MRAPLLLMVDQEGGPVKRLPGAPRRSPPEIAATGDPATALDEGKATAATLREAGMNVDLAPVLDVPRPGGALAAEGRGFGASPAQVAVVRDALRARPARGGVAATAKHFPGFGAAEVNTDAAAVRIDVPASELRRIDQAPFRWAIDAGVDLVMLSSAVYPALDPRPAVLSRRIATGELRDRLGFRGVSISDDLQTPAFGAWGGSPGAAVRATRARRRSPAVRADLRGRDDGRRGGGGGRPARQPVAACARGVRRAGAPAADVARSTPA